MSNGSTRVEPCAHAIDSATVRHQAPQTITTERMADEPAAEPAADAMPELPGGLSFDDITDGVTEILNTESWDTLTVKVILAKLEASKLPTHPPGTLKPFKKFVKEQLDVLMKKKMAENEAAAAAPAPPPEPPKAAEP